MEINNIIDGINKTHDGMGNLVATLYVATTARKLTLIVSPSGCGKSTAMNIIGKNMQGCLRPDKMSIAGIQAIADKLTSFRSVIIVDDMATTQTPYARASTMTTLASLVYTHRVESVMNNVLYEIEDFYGSALVGIQPILLRDLMLASEWDASIQDKALRYYHLYRPISPDLHLPDVKLPRIGDIDGIKDFEPDYESSYWHQLVLLADSQWSRARSKEHLLSMLKAIVAIEGRDVPESKDYELLLRLLKPMAIENIVVRKEQLEGDRMLDNNLLATLAEYYSYQGKFSLAQIASDYKLTLSQCYRIMQTQNGNWQQVSKSPTIYKPSKQLLELLKSYHLELTK